MNQRSPHRARLTRGRVIEAAIAVAQAEDLPALTIRRVARELGSSPMALYRHVSDRDELLAAMLNEASAAMPVTASGAAPAPRLISRFSNAHDFLAERLWIPQLLTRGDLVATSTFGFADACMADLIEAGLPPGQALFAFGTCWHLMLGELLDRHPRDLGDRPTQRERAVRDIDVTSYPHYAHVLAHLDPLDGPPSDRFPEAITLLVTGIVASGTSETT